MGLTISASPRGVVINSPGICGRKAAGTITPPVPPKLRVGSIPLLISIAAAKAGS